MLHSLRPWASAFLVAAALAATPGRAFACGACIHGSQMESTQVTAHRMVLSISKQSTTLWDQVEYVGSPSEFAWVLPIKGQVDVGVSSEVFFEAIDNATRVQIESPMYHCYAPTPGGGGCNTSASKAAAGGFVSGSDHENVQVLQQAVVGPYETVQLAATDPMALRNWLSGHGYVVPVDLDPVIDAYVAEGFGFLAVRLVPGTGIQAMQPIRVTSPGAATTLPLRMVAGGTGAFTAITLWVIGEGRYEPSSMPTFQIANSDLVWDWQMKRSNYAELRQAGVMANGGATWLVESVEGESAALFDGVVQQTMQLPENSGYGMTDPVGLAQADEKAAIGGLAPNAITISRLYAQLPRAALNADLPIGAASDQALVPRLKVASKTIGGDPCGQVTFACDGYGFGGAGGNGFGDTTGGLSGGACGCSLSGQSSRAGLFVTFALAALGLHRLRRRS